MTFTELCQFCLVLIGLADLIVRIIKKKQPPTATTLNGYFL